MSDEDTARLDWLQKTRCDNLSAPGYGFAWHVHAYGIETFMPDDLTPLHITDVRKAIDAARLASPASAARREPVDAKGKTFCRVAMAEDFRRRYRQFNEGEPTEEFTTQYVEGWAANLTREGFSNVNAQPSENSNA